MINGLLQSGYMLVALDYEGLGEPCGNELRLTAKWDHGSVYGLNIANIISDVKSLRPSQ